MHRKRRSSLKACGELARTGDPAAPWATGLVSCRSAPLPSLPGKEGDRQTLCKSHALAGLARLLGKHQAAGSQAATFTLGSSSDQMQMSRPHKQPYLGPRRQRGLQLRAPTPQRGGLLVCAGLCPTNHTETSRTGGVGSTAFTGAGGENTLSSKEAHCSSRSALTEGDAATLRVPRRGGAWTQRPQEHPRPQERGTQVTCPQGLSTPGQGQHQEPQKAFRSLPEIRFPGSGWTVGDKQPHFLQKPHGYFHCPGRFRNNCS